MNNTKVFLKDEKVFARIIEASELTETDTVLEIGSGDGRLTGRIAPRVKKVYAVEKDLNLLDASKVFLSEHKNIEFVAGDILELNFPDDVDKIVANLPYAISSPVTTKIVHFLAKKPGSFAVLMYQKEFAERMLAFPGIKDYSMLTVFCQYTSKVRKIANVSKNSFRPRPAVDSMIIRLEPKNKRVDEGFLAFTKLIFQHKKKNLYSAIMDSRRGMSVDSKDELRRRLASMDKTVLKEKVFFFSIEELEHIYEEAVRVKIWSR